MFILQQKKLFRLKGLRWSSVKEGFFRSIKVSIYKYHIYAYKVMNNINACLYLNCIYGYVFVLFIIELATVLSVLLSLW